MNDIVLVGLGNPGAQFEGTRHNLGQDMLTAWVESIAQDGATVLPPKQQEKLHATIQQLACHDIAVSVVFPNVFMNESGKTVAQYLRYHEIPRQHIIVVHDDLELALGLIKYQASGSAHGHNGVRSIHEYIGDREIPQLRIGIGRPVDQAIEKFVLASFTPDEKKTLQQSQSLFNQIVSDLILQRPLPE